MKKFLKLLTFFILFLQFIFFANCVEARGIEVRAKLSTDNNGEWDGGVKYLIFIGAYPQTINEFTNETGNLSTKYDRKKFHYLNVKNNDYYIGTKQAPEKIFDLEWSNILKDYESNTVRSWSVLVQKDELTNYTNGKDYCYATTKKGSEYPSNTPNWTSIGGEKKNVATIEFKRLTEGYQIIQVGHNPPISVNSE